MPATPDLFIPAAFSPDGDGVNDVFEIRGLSNYPGNKLYIFNRWGNLIYSATDYDNSWKGVGKNGEPLIDGTYYYVFEPKNGKESMKGYFVIAH